MKKIPTLFKRDPDDLKRVLPEVNPGCEWVLAGEGRATRKFDGTCCMFDGSGWWARREVKPGKPLPQVFMFEDADTTTGKTVGWVPLETSAFAKWHAEALESESAPIFRPGTYELCGPKINGNPERFPSHILLRHEAAVEIILDADELNYEGLRGVLLSLAVDGVEGIVWHHTDGRMAKLKARDFAWKVARAS